jgi:signal transduction histidine kinase
VCAVTAAVTAAHDLMPRLLDGNGILPLGYFANGAIALINLFALVLLWFRGKSVLDLWLMVAVCALLLETALVALLMPSRFSVFFYSSRVISLLVSKVVLIVLLSETMRLYMRLSIANRNLQRESKNRLASAEATVAVIAHEIRQPLNSMSMRASAGQLLLNQASPDINEVRLLFQQIENDTRRANEVFKTFLTLFGERNEQRTLVDMNNLVRGVIELLHNELSANNVTTVKKFASELPPVLGSRGQLRELLLNLIQNAIEAMAATTNRPRIITVATERLDSSSVRISLQDTGPGIDPQKLPTIFDLFVTTKPKGTGLGLGICKMVVDRHRGKLSAASHAGGGARFEIMLPIQ